MPAVTNALVDALSEFGVRHIEMPATPGAHLARHAGGGMTGGGSPARTGRHDGCDRGVSAAPNSSRPGDSHVVKSGKTPVLSAVPLMAAALLACGVTSLTGHLRPNALQ